MSRKNELGERKSNSLLLLVELTSIFVWLALEIERGSYS